MRSARGGGAGWILAVAVVLVLGAGADAQASPTGILWVDPGFILDTLGPDACNGPPFFPRYYYPYFCTIQDALDVAFPGNVIYVATGPDDQFTGLPTPYEGFTVRVDRLVIVGEFVQLQECLDTSPAGATNITIAASFVRLQGFYLHFPCGIGIHVRGSFNWVSNNWVEGPLDYGIWVDERSFHNQILANRVSFAGLNGDDPCGQGIRVNHGPPPNGTGTVVSYNVVMGSCDDGYFFGRPTVAQLNVSLNNLGDGFEVGRYGKGSTLTRNVALDNDTCDISRVGTSTTVSLSGNVAQSTYLNDPADCQH